MLLVIAPLAGCQLVHDELVGPPPGPLTSAGPSRTRQGSNFSQSPGYEVVRNELFGPPVDAPRPAGRRQPPYAGGTGPTAPSQVQNSATPAGKPRVALDQQVATPPARLEIVPEQDEPPAPAPRPAPSPTREHFVARTRPETVAAFADPEDATANHRPERPRQQAEPERPATGNKLATAESRRMPTTPAALPDGELVRALEDYDVDDPPAPPAWLVAEATKRPRPPSRPLGASEPAGNPMRFVDVPRARAPTAQPEDERSEPLADGGRAKTARSPSPRRDSVVDAESAGLRAVSEADRQALPRRSESAAGRPQLASWERSSARLTARSLPRPYAARLEPWQQHVRERQAAFQLRSAGGFNPLREGDDSPTAADDSLPATSADNWRSANNWRSTTPMMSMDGPNWEPNPLRTR